MLQTDTIYQDGLALLAFHAFAAASVIVVDAILYWGQHYETLYMIQPIVVAFVGQFLMFVFAWYQAPSRERDTEKIRTILSYAREHLQRLEIEIRTLADTTGFIPHEDPGRSASEERDSAGVGVGVVSTPGALPPASSGATADMAHMTEKMQKLRSKHTQLVSEETNLRDILSYYQNNTTFPWDVARYLSDKRNTRSFNALKWYAYISIALNALFVYLAINRLFVCSMSSDEHFGLWGARVLCESISGSATLRMLVLSGGSIILSVMLITLLMRALRNATSNETALSRVATSIGSALPALLVYIAKLTAKHQAKGKGVDPHAAGASLESLVPDLDIGESRSNGLLPTYGDLVRGGQVGDMHSSAWAWLDVFWLVSPWTLWVVLIAFGLSLATNVWMWSASRVYEVYVIHPAYIPLFAFCVWIITVDYIHIAAWRTKSYVDRFIAHHVRQLAPERHSSSTTATRVRDDDDDDEESGRSATAGKDTELQPMLPSTSHVDATTIETRDSVWSATNDAESIVSMPLFASNFIAAVRDESNRLPLRSQDNYTPLRSTAPGTNRSTSVDPDYSPLDDDNMTTEQYTVALHKLRDTYAVVTSPSVRIWSFLSVILLILGCAHSVLVTVTMLHASLECHNGPDLSVLSGIKRNNYCTESYRLLWPSNGICCNSVDHGGFMFTFGAWLSLVVSVVMIVALVETVAFLVFAFVATSPDEFVSKVTSLTQARALPTTMQQVRATTTQPADTQPATASGATIVSSARHTQISLANIPTDATRASIGGRVVGIFNRIVSAVAHTADRLVSRWEYALAATKQSTQHRLRHKQPAGTVPVSLPNATPSPSTTESSYPPPSAAPADYNQPRDPPKDTHSSSETSARKRTTTTFPPDASQATPQQYSRGSPHRPPGVGSTRRTRFQTSAQLVGSAMAHRPKLKR